MDTKPRPHPVTVAVQAVAIAGAVLAVPAIAGAQTAATLYERAQAREAAAREETRPSIADLRAAATAYENLVRRHPTSGYTDNALWQAAGLRALAWERSGEQADVDRAIRYLEWLRDEYPHSSLVRDARTMIGSLRAKATAQTVAVSAVRTSGPARLPDARSAASDATPVAGALARIETVTREAIPRGDRITIQLSREVTYTGDRVDGPDRLFFDFIGTLPLRDAEETIGQLDGTLVRGFRVGRHPNQTTRIVFDLQGRPRHSAYLRYDPFRLVIDLETDAPARAPLTPAPFPAPRAAVTPPAGRSLPAPPRVNPAGVLPVGAGTVTVDAPPMRPAVPEPPATAVEATALPVEAVIEPPGAPIDPPTRIEPEPAASTSRGDYSLARQLGLGVSRIVIDPGHGGHDPGAQAHGVVESQLVLDIARRLETLLSSHPGVEVLLTRTDDTFIPLEERTAFANRQGADLFLSIHANSSRQASTRGVETYVLNFATNEAAEAVAARENATSARSMGNLPDIVKAIALNDKLAESRELATMVQTALVRSLRTQSSGVRDLGVKQAPFVVLIGADMPSILAEVSFLTNRAEAGLLKTEAYRQQIAQALHDALVKYQTSLKKITTVASREESR